MTRAEIADELEQLHDDRAITHAAWAAAAFTPRAEFDIAVAQKTCADIAFNEAVQKHLTTILAALRGPDEAAVERANLAAEAHFGPVCGKTGEWCLVPGSSPLVVARAVLAAGVSPAVP